MKNTVCLMFISAMICGLTLFGCGKQLENTAGGELNVFVTKAKATEIDKINDLLFTCDDIVSFNVKTGEIVFKRGIMDERMFHAQLHFFIGEKPVFSEPLKIYFDVMSQLWCDLLFVVKGGEQRGGFFIKYFGCSYLEDKKKASKHAEKMKKREKELDVLIKYLRNAGKIASKK